MYNRFSAADISKQLIISCQKKQLDLQLLAYLGHMAPSVHNTQPWILRLDNQRQSIDVTLCHPRLLTHSDPTHRQAWISIGALVQNILTVAQHLPVNATLHGEGTENVLLSFQLKDRLNHDADGLQQTITAILERHSNRQAFQAQPLAKTTLVQLVEGSKANNGAKVVFISDTKKIERLAEMTQQASLLAFSSASLRQELAQHLTPPFSRRRTGIPTSSLSSSTTRALFERSLTKSIRFITSNAAQEYRRIAQSPLLALLLTPGDVQHDWLNAGLRYEQLCLRVTELGLQHSTTAALVEAPDYYKDVAAVLHDTWRLQAVVRIGHGTPAKSRGKRLALEQILTV